MSPYNVSFDNLGQYEIIYISSIFPIHVTAKIASANLYLNYMVMEYKLLCACISINARLHKDGEGWGGGRSISFLYARIFLGSLSVTLQLIRPLLILLHWTSLKVDI